MTLVFVYGTLKRGGCNHSFLADQSYLGEARTVPGFRLYELDGFPGMVAKGDDLTGVTGEVWSVDDVCLVKLDQLEGVGEGLYFRATIKLLSPFANQSVETYLYLRNIEGRRELGPTWSE